MANIDNLTFGELKEISRMFFEKSTQPKDPGGAMRIVVLDRGWVVVGELTLKDNEYILLNSRVIRKWGTTDGLMQLANHGPTDKTVLEEIGTIRFNAQSVVLQFEVEDKTKW